MQRNDLRKATARIKAAHFQVAMDLIQRIADNAYAQGFRDGVEQGRAEGLEEGILAAREGA
jgi:flagellar biosynthesis/type III secretory pathway protein FliH